MLACKFSISFSVLNVLTKLGEMFVYKCRVLTINAKMPKGFKNEALHFCTETFQQQEELKIPLEKVSPFQ